MFSYDSISGYKIHHQRNCGGNRILTWRNGLHAKYGQLKGISNCTKICKNHSDCGGFSHRLLDDVCGLWRKAPLKPYNDTHFNCYEKRNSKFLHCNITQK